MKLDSEETFPFRYRLSPTLLEIKTSDPELLDTFELGRWTMRGIGSPDGEELHLAGWVRSIRRKEKRGKYGSRTEWTIALELDNRLKEAARSDGQET